MLHQLTSALIPQLIRRRHPTSQARTSVERSICSYRQLLRFFYAYTRPSTSILHPIITCSKLPSQASVSGNAKVPSQQVKKERNLGSKELHFTSLIG
jgi:hypothetical protein